jgi:hypothetical protein
MTAQSALYVYNFLGASGTEAACVICCPSLRQCLSQPACSSMTTNGACTPITRTGWRNWHPTSPSAATATTAPARPVLDGVQGQRRRPPEAAGTVVDYSTL